MKEVNGAMISESILLVSDGDDDVTFNGKGIDNGKNDQTLLADFGSKITVSFPEIGNAEAIFKAQQANGTITLDMVYCAPKAESGSPVTIPAHMIPMMERQAQKMREIYRQIGIQVDGFAIKLMTFPEVWVQDNGESDPVNHLDGSETNNLIALIKLGSGTSKRIRVGFVNAVLTDPLTGNPAGGIADSIGGDSCLVSVSSGAHEPLNVLAHEVGHVLGLSHNSLYTPNNNHWLMRFAAGAFWSNDSSAPKRFMTIAIDDDFNYIKNNSSYYAPAQ